MNTTSKNNYRQWKIIEKILLKRNSPTIIWITCDDYFYRTEMIDSFKNRFSEQKHQVLSLKNFSENNFNSFFIKNLPNSFFSTKSINKTVHLVDIESLIYPHLSTSSKEHFIRTLNFEREVLFHDFPFYIVFWSDTLSMKQIQRFAPDFYDWVSYKFDFEYYFDKKKQNDEIELNKTRTFVGNENVIYNRISRRLHTLEQIPQENENDRYSLFLSIVQDYNSVNDYNKAEKVIEELLKLNNITKGQIASIKLLQANVFSQLSRLNEAKSAYEEALNIYRKLAKENPRTYLPDVAMTLNNLAVLQKDKNEFPQALEKYEEALNIYRKLAKENPRTYLPDVAGTLNNLAILQKAKNDFPQALANFEEALNIYRELAKENPRTYLPAVAGTLNNLALLQKAKNEFPQALENYEEALNIYRELAKENPRTYLPDVAGTLNNLALLQKAKNEFPQALANFEEALNIYRELAKENPRVYDIDYAKSILTGIILLSKGRKDLNEAREILLKYKGIPQADGLLKIIDKIERKE